MASNNLMDNLQVDLQISPQLERLMRNNSQIASKASKKGLAAIAKEGAKNAKTLMRAEGFKESGKLIKSINAKTTNNKSSYGAKSRIAHIIEDGSHPHEIKPKNKKVMWFESVFAHKVHHPGTPAFEPFKRTEQMMESSGQVKSLFDDAVRQAIQAVQNGG